MSQMQQIPEPYRPGQALFFDDHRKQWLCFSNPLEIITASSVSQVIPALQHVERQIKKRRCAAAGWISYEAAPAFDEALSVRQDTSGFPLLRFALYTPPRVTENFPLDYSRPPLFEWEPTVNYREYLAAIQRIKRYIAQGDTYQVNFTYRRRAPFSREDLYGLSPLINQQPPFYGGMIADDQWVVSSGSPELFFTLHNGLITSRPMKGTAPRGLSYLNDRELAAALFHSIKNRAENVMIVDMVRNDISKIAKPGSVRVPELFSLEQYPTLHQMTSTVQAQTSASISEIFGALFPPASITGAPKKRTMEIISELENTPRRIYTGTMGFILPDNRAQFNVAIRTLLFDRQAAKLEYGVGSGIVWDSDPEEEFEECKTKTFICKPPPKPFSLLETIRWTPDEGFAYLHEHLARIGNSALYFNIPLDTLAVRRTLSGLAQDLPPAQHKIRLLVDRSGRITTEHTPIEPLEEDYCATVALANVPVEDTCFLYHKTTNRTVYEQASAGNTTADDILLFNCHGELTESTIANIIMVMDGVWYTPPVRCGLLPGTARENLLKTGKLVERVLPVDLLNEDHTLMLVNSVRGIYRAHYTVP